WWDDVCEDALTIAGGSASSVAKIIGGGARSADDKIIQHNGAGTVSIEGCKTQYQRKVTVTNVYAVNPKATVVGVNKNYGDQATLSNIKIKSSKKADKLKVCTYFQGVTSGEPKQLGNGILPPTCQYAASDIQVSATAC
ncbi:hypothetical protein AeNC1_014448, partial [Aphanomyces euteiches]